MFKCSLQSRATYINFWTPFHVVYNQGWLTIKNPYSSTKQFLSKCRLEDMTSLLSLQHFGVRFWGFPKKQHWNAHGFMQEFLQSCKCYGPGRSVKRRGKSSSLHSKNFFFGWGCRFFVSDVISRGFLGYFSPLYLALGANR